MRGDSCVRDSLSAWNPSWSFDPQDLVDGFFRRDSNVTRWTREEMAFLLFFRNVKKKKKTKNPNRRNPGARPEGRGRRLSTLIQTAGYIEENRGKKRNRAISSHVPLGGVETTCCQRLVRASAGQFTSENKRIKSVGREKLTYEPLLSYNNIRKTIESSTGEDIGVCWLFASQVRRRRPCQVAACQTVGAGSTLKRSLSLFLSVRPRVYIVS